MTLDRSEIHARAMQAMAGARARRHNLHPPGATV